MADGDRQKPTTYGGRSLLNFEPTEEEGLRFFLRDADAKDKKGRFSKNIVIRNDDWISVSLRFSPAVFVSFYFLLWFELLLCSDHLLLLCLLTGFVVQSQSEKTKGW